MIQIQDLRIGNLVMYNDQNHEPSPTPIKVGISDLILIIEDTKECVYAPIPLTEEILLKAGFEFWCDELGIKCFYKIYGIEYFCVATNGFYQLRSGLKDSDAAWRLGNNYPFIKHLHQLQNLYFALTGEELKITL